LKLYRERLFNFESTHQNRVRAREQQRERGELVDPPEETFYTAQLDDREALTRDIMKATSAMQHLRRECEQAGIPVEEPVLPPLADNDALDHSLRIPRALRNLTARDPMASLLNPRQSLLLGDRDNKARVSRWLSEMLQAQRVDSFDVLVPEPETAGRPNTESRTADESFTEKEAEVLLPLPDYGLLLLGPNLNNPLEIHGKVRFHPDPPSRRYSEPTVQVRRFDIDCRSCMEQDTSKSVT
jgi:hypothetical protein